VESHVQAEHARVSLGFVPARWPEAKPLGQALTPAFATHAANALPSLGTQTLPFEQPAPTRGGGAQTRASFSAGIDTIGFAAHTGCVGGTSFAFVPVSKGVLPPTRSDEQLAFTPSAWVTLHKASPDATARPAEHEPPHEQSHAAAAPPVTADFTSVLAPNPLGHEGSCAASTYATFCQSLGAAATHVNAPHALSAQSVLPLQSLSMPSSQISGPVGVQRPPLDPLAPLAPLDPADPPSPVSNVMSGTEPHAASAQRSPHPRTTTNAEAWRTTPRAYLNSKSPAASRPRVARA
jgi:hypothetical protein